MRKIPVSILVMLILGLPSCSSGFLSPGDQPGQTSEASMETAIHTPAGVTDETGAEAVEEPPEPVSPVLPFGIKKYRVGQGDSLFGIADKFGIRPETILYSNYEVLQDKPHTLKSGMELYVPVVDGVVYHWQEGDQITKVADRFHVKPELIVMWAPNQIDHVAYSSGENIEIEPGSIIFIPAGWRSMEAMNLPTVNP